MLPNEIHCSGSFIMDELPKEELAHKVRQQKRWGGIKYHIQDSYANF